MHRHFWRIKLRKHAPTMYVFTCECGEKRMKYKYGFWFGVTCPHGYGAGDHHFETGYCHKYPTGSETWGTKATFAEMREAMDGA